MRWSHQVLNQDVAWSPLLALKIFVGDRPRSQTYGNRITSSLLVAFSKPDRRHMLIRVIGLERIIILKLNGSTQAANEDN